MTRNRLFPWLAIPALLLVFGAALPTAHTAPAASEDGLIYAPLNEAQTSRGTAMERMQVLASEEAQASGFRLAQYGEADNAVANRNKWLAVRFDPPGDAPYQITGILFRTLTLLQNPSQFASFRSVRLIVMDPATGLPDKSQTLYHQARYLGSSNGGVNHVKFQPPISINDPDKSFFWVWEFPAPVTGVGDTFPFVFTDRGPTEAGLFANSFAMDTTATVSVAPPALGTIVGTALLADQNIECSMTIEPSGALPPDRPRDLGLNLLPGGAEWSYNVSGAATVELVTRNPEWTVVASTPGNVEAITLPGVPGAGTQIWGVRSVAGGGTRSEVSNVTITGSTSVIGTFGANAEDADEPNGSNLSADATSLPLPISGRLESIWPAGDLDNFVVQADPGQIISVSAAPAAVDFRNDMELVLKVFSKPNKVVASETGAPASSVELNYVVPPSPGNSNQPVGPFVIQVSDRYVRGGGQPNTPRVLTPSGYFLNVDVLTPAAMVQGEPGLGASSGAGPDKFAFANAGANPVRGRAAFSYVIPRGHNEDVKLRIYDVRGRVMATLVNGPKSAGTHFAVWSGSAPAGAYFARFEAGTFVRTVRLEVLN